MKTFVLSIFVLCASLIGYSQTTNPLPCVQYYSNSNLGGGDCKTAKQGNLKYYPGYGTTPANMNYFPTGKFVIYFKSPVPAGTKAPEILSAGVDDGDGNILPPPYDYKYAPHNDDFSVARSSITYCYYGSGSNQNIFNGAKAPYLAFIIKYEGADSSICTKVTTPVTLPVSFKTFTASRVNSSNSLKWTTSFEMNNKGFYVQRFYNNKWENLGFIATKAENGLSETDLNYTYSDVFNFKGVVQYRILQVDLDGKSKYSEIRSISISTAASNVLVYPNPAPANGNVSLVLSNATSTYDIQVVDNSGRIVKEFNSVRSTQQVSGLPKGQYLARVKERESGFVSVEKFIMQ